MKRSCVGIDIGTCEIKMAVCGGGRIQRTVTEELPDHLVKEGRIVSPQAMSDFIKNAARKNKIKTKNCGVILPSSIAFVRSMTLPAMAREHLELNLSYEFRDFITQEKDKYFYDYAVLGKEEDEAGKPKNFELIGAATLKENIKNYTDLFRRSGFKLVTAIPEELAYMNLINQAARRKGPAVLEQEYGFVDLGHTAARLHFFKGNKHQANRVIDYGMSLLDLAIAEEHHVDEHIARFYKHANHKQEQESEGCQRIYESITLELMRAINFYRFNSPDNRLEGIYLCGGGSKVAPLVAQITRELPTDVHVITDLLLPEETRLTDVELCQAAIGVGLQ